MAEEKPTAVEPPTNKEHSPFKQLFNAVTGSLRRTGIPNSPDVLANLSHSRFTLTPEVKHKMKIDQNAVLIRESDLFPNLPIPMEILKSEIDRSGKSEVSPSGNIMWALDDMGRSVILPGPFEFSTVNGDSFYFISIKGVGATDIRAKHIRDPNLILQSKEAYVRIRADNLVDHIEGASAVESLQADFDNSLILHRNGVRTSLPITVHQSSVGGKEARALKNFERLSSLANCVFNHWDIDPKSWSPHPEKADSILDNAKLLLTREGKFGKVESDEEFLRIFIEQTGRSLGIMHRIGYIHRRETNAGGLDRMQNITLSAEIVDHDTGEFADKKSQGDRDLLINQYLVGLINVATAYESISKLRNCDPKGIPRDQLVSTFTKEYLAQLNPFERAQMQFRLKEVFFKHPSQVSSPETKIFALGDSEGMNGKDLYDLVATLMEHQGYNTFNTWTEAITNHWAGRNIVKTTLAI